MALGSLSRTLCLVAGCCILAAGWPVLGQDKTRPAEIQERPAEKPGPKDQPAEVSPVRPAEPSAAKPKEKAAELQPAIKGYCPVSYHTDNQAVKGDPQHHAEYQGLVYFFADSERKKMFEADPEKYLPRIGGLCTVSLGGPYGNRFRGDPTVFTLVDGKVYFCSSERAKRSFDKRPEEYAKNAEQLYLAPELNGICLVSLQKQGVPTRGQEQYKQTYRAKVYFFTTEENLAEFKKDPMKYVPQFEGYCAYKAAQGSAVPGDRSIFAVIDGKTYFFADLEARARCTANPSECIPKAHANWPKINQDVGRAPGGA